MDVVFFGIATETNIEVLGVSQPAPVTEAIPRLGPAGDVGSVGV